MIATSQQRGDDYAGGDRLSLKAGGGSDEIKLLVLDGDGTSTELIGATLKILQELGQVAGLHFRTDIRRVGFQALADSGTTFPDAVLEAARTADGVILGPVSHNDYPPAAAGGLNPSGQLRQQLDLYANIRPAKSHVGLPMRVAGSMDLVVVRENTEGFYADRSMYDGPGEFMPTRDLAMSLRKITRSGSTRIAESAFQLAGQRRRKVTAVHKANVLRVTDGLFLECVRNVAAAHPDVEYEEQLIDAMAALVIRNPSRFDVICTTNMFGDILSDEATEISGSIGLGASLNVGETHAVAQAQHGSAPGLTGRDVVNPYSLISSAGMLLHWLGTRRGSPTLIAAAAAIEEALDMTVANPLWRTADLGGPLGTSAFTDRVAANIGDVIGRRAR
ncbi:MAG: isocitrate/isopropylmalate family dehydrogenase [Devosia sp.]